MIRRLSALVLALLLAGGPIAAQAETVLRRGNGAEPQTLDPHRSSGQPEAHLTQELFEGLTAPDGKGGVIPGAAERWDISPDGLVWTFHLRPGLKWSDGSALTADDFVFAWRRLLDPKVASDYAYFLWAVVNAEEASLGRKPLDSVGVRAVDQRTVEVRLRTPVPYFPAVVAHHSTYPVSRANLEKFGAEFVKPGNMVGNGAYRLVEAVPQGHIKMVRNPHFHDAASVKIDTVYFYPTENLEAELKRFRAGELDVTYDVPVSQTALLRGALKEQYREAPLFATYFYAPNLTREPWKSSRELRLAFNLAIDRQILTEKVLGLGQRPAYAFVPPGTPDYTTQVPDYGAWTQAQRDARARELVKAAGYGPGGKPLEVEIIFNTHDNHRRLAIAIAAMWQQKLGAKVTMNNQEWKVFLDTRDGKTYKDVARHGWNGDVNDASNFLELLRSDIGKQNPTGYANPAFDRLLVEANASSDPARRRALLEEAERLALHDVALFPIYTYASHHLVAPRVKGWTDNPKDEHPTRFLSVEP